ncbi:head-to-tail connector protein [Rhodococcus phage Mbo2]|uniref:Head-to-tail connector protein n=1 Tax=Rhodococcus phage Mbo2 TaxID=2936911 RepID=A0A9E7IPJ1_9CAUD|nr:head-to-tail connector protein [Rhodococcus phage Mbo2]
MPPAGVSVNSARVDRLLKTLINNTSDAILSTALAGSIHQHLQRRMVKRFAAGGDDASGTWTPLSEATLEIRQSLGFTRGDRKGQINVRTGHMKDQLTKSKPDVSVTPVAVALSFPGNGISERPDMFHRTQQALGNRRGPARPTLAYNETDVAVILTSLAKAVGRGAVTFGGSD